MKIDFGQVEFRPTGPAGQMEKNLSVEPCSDYSTFRAMKWSLQLVVLHRTTLPTEDATRPWPSAGPCRRLLVCQQLAFGVAQRRAPSTPYLRHLSLQCRTN